MDIPKYVGVVFSPFEDGAPAVEYVRHGNDEETVKSETLEAYRTTVSNLRESGEPESNIELIGWDIYVSTRATANSPDAIHHGFEGPGA